MMMTPFPIGFRYGVERLDDDNRGVIHQRINTPELAQSEVVGGMDLDVDCDLDHA
jgi:hypothetical protein